MAKAPIWTFSMASQRYFANKDVIIAMIQTKAFLALFSVDCSFFVLPLVFLCRWYPMYCTLSQGSNKVAWNIYEKIYSVSRNSECEWLIVFLTHIIAFLGMNCHMCYKDIQMRKIFRLYGPIGASCPSLTLIS